MVYAIVRAGGRQEKVSVGDLVTLDRVTAEAGSNIELQPLMLVDGDKVVTAADELSKVKVTAEVVRTCAVQKLLFRSTRTRPATRYA